MQMSGGDGAGGGLLSEDRWPDFYGGVRHGLTEQRKTDTFFLTWSDVPEDAYAEPQSDVCGRWCRWAVYAPYVVPLRIEFWVNRANFQTFTERGEGVRGRCHARVSLDK